MAVPRCVLCCSLRGGIARTAGWSDGFRQVASFSSSVVISNGLQPSLEGLGPTSEPVDGRVQAWTRLALDSFKGSNPVWRATGHNEPVDGRVQTWTRHVSEQLSASEHRQDVHRNVCETIGLVQPTRMGDRFWQVSPRGVQVDGRGRGRHLLGVRQYAVVLTYYWVRSRVTSLVGLFVFPFVLAFLLGRAELSGLRFGHFYVFRGPGAVASGHTGSLPGCAQQSVLCPGGGKVGNQVKQTACRFLKAPQPTQRASSEREQSFKRGPRIGKVRFRLGVTSESGKHALARSLHRTHPCKTTSVLGSHGRPVLWRGGLLCVSSVVKVV